MDNSGMVIWIVGLSGAGKSVIGKEVCGLLRRTRPAVVFLDGDAVRAMFGNDLGYTLAERRKNAWRIARLAASLDAQGVDVVCAVLCVTPEVLEWNRRSIAQYFEVYLKVPMSVLIARDRKNLYRAALRGETENVVGVDLPFEEPVRSDLILSNGEGSAAEGATAIVSRLPWAS